MIQVSHCAQMSSPSASNSEGMEGDKYFHSSQPDYESINSQG